MPESSTRLTDSESRPRHWLRASVEVLLAVSLPAVLLLHWYLPRRTERAAVERELQEALGRCQALERRLERMRLSRDELEARNAEAIEQAVRERLRAGPEGSYRLAPDQP